MRRTGVLIAGTVALVALAAMRTVQWQTPDVSPELSGLEQGAQALLSRARQLRDDASDFDQDAALSGLGQSAARGFHYRLDDRLSDAEIEVLPLERHPDDAGYGFEFNGEDPIALEPWQGPHEVADGEIRFRQVARGFLATRSTLEIDKESIGVFELRMRVDKGRRATLMWGKKTLGPELLEPSTDGAGVGAGSFGLPGWVGTVVVDLVPDGEFHTYRLNASTALWRKMKFKDKKIRMLGLAASDVEGDRVAIDYLRLVPKREKYESVAAGTTSETLGGEMRSTLHVRSPATLTWSMTLPDEGAEMSFGAGVLEAGDPTTFTVSVLVGDDSYEVTSTTVEDNAGWSDQSVDLSAWGGQAVQIRLENQSAQGNIAFWSNPVVHGKSEQRFNVIVVLEDTMRADHLSSYGHHLETSPAKDHLASRGVLFKHVVSQATKTRPSVPSLMTSLLPSATGVWNHSHILDERYLTLAEILRHQGFATAAFVQNSNASPASGMHQGYSYLIDRKDLGTGPHIFDDGVFDWIEKHKDRNFFAYMHVIDPHGVYEPPEAYRNFWEDSPGGTPVEANYKQFDAEWVTDPTIESRRLLYDGEIAHNDYWFGKFLERLAQLGLEDDTLVINLSDHGEHLGERGQWGHDPPGYLQTIRVPLIMAHPTLLPAGQRFDETVQLLDVMPTILDLAGIPTDGLLLQGDSLRSLVEGEEREYWRDRVALSEEAILYEDRTAPQASGSAFFGGNHYLRSTTLPGPLAFDFHADPGEEEPLDEQRVAQLGAVLDPTLDELIRINNQLRTNITGDAAAVIEYDPDAQEQLRALGYIE